MRGFGYQQAFDRHGGDCFRHGAARKGAQSHREDGNKELSLPTSLGQIKRNWGSHEWKTSWPPPAKSEVRNVKGRCAERNEGTLVLMHILFYSEAF